MEREKAGKGSGVREGEMRENYGGVRKVMIKTQ